MRVKQYKISSHTSFVAVLLLGGIVGNLHAEYSNVTGVNALHKIVDERNVSAKDLRNIGSNTWNTLSSKGNVYGDNNIVDGGPLNIIGNDNSIVGSGSTVGFRNQSYGENNTAIGSELGITSNKGVAIGHHNTAIGEQAVVIGSDNISRGDKDKKPHPNSGVVIGSKNFVTGERGIAIGAGNELDDSDGIALGGAKSTNGGIAIGKGSNAQQADEVNIGERQLTGVKAGTEDSHATNLQQLKESAAHTLSTANANAIQGDAATLAGAKAHTDSSVAAESKARQVGDAATLAGAKAHTDSSVAAESKARQVGDAATLAGAKAHTDSSVAAESKARQVGDAATLAGAKAHSETRNAQTLARSKTHTDASVAAEATARQAGDVSTLRNANGYTDRREVSIRNDMSQGNQNTLNSANSYTDNSVKAHDAKFGDALDGAYSFIRKENQKMRNEYRAIGSLAMASSAIGIAPRELGRSQFGIAMGSVQSASALAVGLNHYINDSTVFTFRGAVGTSTSVTGGAIGVVKGWR